MGRLVHVMAKRHVHCLDSCARTGNLPLSKRIRVWDALDGNLLRKNCSFQRFHLVKGVVGPKPKLVSGDGYGAYTKDVEKGQVKQWSKAAASHALTTLDGPFDTLCIV